MTVTVVKQDLFDSQAQAIVITVNCVGAMGRGVAAVFKAKWPHLFLLYTKRCRSGRISPGVITRNETFQLPDGRYAILMPTKFHWRNPSQLGWIKSGLKDLDKVASELGLDSIAMPPAGCGNGWLNWDDVLPMINEQFADNVDLELTVCMQ